MKTKIFLIIGVLIATVALISCSKSKDNSLTSEQQVLLGKLKVAYSTAKAFDDSLITCTTSAVHDSILIHHYDTCYHRNDTIFMNCHTNMMNTTGGMMSGNGSMTNMSGGMMGGNGGMMGNNNNNHTMCNSNNADFNLVMNEMNQLRATHIKYHPK
jgi:hypothetical protein